MNSDADLSELGSQSNLGDKEEEQEESEEQQQEQENEGEEQQNEEQEEGGQELAENSAQKRHVTFKDTQPDTIQSVYKEVNSISSSIDQFLTKLQKQPINNGQNKYRQQFTQLKGPIYPNYSQAITLHNNYQKPVLPQIQLQNNQQIDSNINSKFFYTKQDMASARQLQNSNARSIYSRRDDNQMNQEQNQSMMNASKYNYYGNYRFQTDKINNSLAASNTINLQHYKQPLSQRQTLNDIHSYNNLNKQSQQPNIKTQTNSYNFTKNIGDINSQMEELSKSIHQDTVTHFYNSAQQYPSTYQNSIQKQSHSLQRNMYNDSLNQRQNNSFYNSIQQSKQDYDEYIPNNSNKISNQNSLNISRSQNVRDLYKYRPKRVIDESELYGEVQQTFIPNKISVLRSNY